MHLDDRLGRLYGAFHNSRKFDPFLAEFHPASANTVQVEQIVNEPDHVVNLPCHQGARRLDHLVIAGRQLDQFKGVDDRGQWVAQFVANVARNSFLRRSTSLRSSACLRAVMS